jgi:DNA polymerase III alpha subunit
MHPELLVREKHVLARSLGRYVNREVVVAGFIATARKARTSDGRTMGFVTVEDSTGLAEVSFFPDEIDKYRQIVAQPGAIWVRGKVTEHLSSLNIECHGWGRAA